MKDEKAPARPRQITMAAVMAVVGSAVLVLSLFDTLGRLRTPETRQAIDDFLAEPPGSGLALETAQVVELMRMLAYASGALAAMVLVFAVYVLQRHRAARIGLTVAAGLLLVTVPVAGLLPLFIAVAAVLVWSQPARDWYAGRVPAVAGGPAHGGARLSADSDEPSRGNSWPPPLTPPLTPPADPPRDVQPPHQSGEPHRSGDQPRAGDQPPSDDQHRSDDQPRSGDEDQRAAGWPPPGQQPQWAYPPAYGGGAHQPGRDQQGQGHPGQGYPGQYPAQYYGQGYPGQGFPAPYPGQGYGATAYPGPRSADKRPTTVTVAAVLTWLGSGAVIALMLLFAGLLATDGDYFVEEFDNAAGDAQLALSADQVLAAGWTIMAVLLLWSLVSAVLAFFAFRRSNGARITLAVSASCAALLSLLTILSGVAVVTLLLAGATVVLLFSGGANDWYARRGAGTGYPGGYPGGGYPGGYPDAWQQPGHQPPYAPPQEKQQPW